MALRWEGEALKRRMTQAAIQGINATMSACVIYAKQHHAWQNRTGTAEGSINIYTYAEVVGEVVRGLWGSADVNYFLALELGSPAHTIEPRAKHALFWPGAAHPVRRVQHPGTRAYPTLRPAADATYPRLAGLIQRAFARGR